eukprot:scaffold5181_cov125-Isochrysis_galbana.AAC.14
MDLRCPVEPPLAGSTAPAPYCAILRATHHSALAQAQRPHTTPTRKVRVPSPHTAAGCRLQARHRLLGLCGATGGLSRWSQLHHPIGEHHALPLTLAHHTLEEHSAAFRSVTPHPREQALARGKGLGEASRTAEKARRIAVAKAR